MLVQNCVAKAEAQATTGALLSAVSVDKEIG
jgi:hypothetical protein